MKYKDTVKSIVELPWKNLEQKDLFDLLYLSWVSSVEFAESLRIALSLHPESQFLTDMAQGELRTNNLRFAEYSKKGDHSEFLEYFLSQSNYVPSKNTEAAALAYLKECRQLDEETRAMSVFSREAELPNIFSHILSVLDGAEDKTLLAYKYYLEKHIELDSDDGGHSELVSEFPVTDEVDRFYKTRLAMYKSLFNNLKT